MLNSAPINTYAVGASQAPLTSVVTENFSGPHKLIRVGDWVVDTAESTGGTPSLRSAPIIDRQSSTITFDVTYSVGIQFVYRVSSESNYDELIVTHIVDGVRSELLADSGDSGWVTFTVPSTSFNGLAEGVTQELEFTYDKDFSVSRNLDSAFISHITIVTPQISYSSNPIPVYRTFDPIFEVGSPATLPKLASVLPQPASFINRVPVIIESSAGTEYLEGVAVSGGDLIALKQEGFTYHDPGAYMYSTGLAPNDLAFDAWLGTNTSQELQVLINGASGVSAAPIEPYLSAAIATITDSRYVSSLISGVIAALPATTFYNPSAYVQDNLASVLGTALVATSNDVTLLGTAEASALLLSALRYSFEGVAEDSTTARRDAATQINELAQALLQYSNAVTESVTSEATAHLVELLSSLGEVWLTIRAAVDVETGKQLYADEALAALAADPSAAAYTSELVGLADCGDSFTLNTAVRALDMISAALLPQFTLQIFVSEALEGAAEDSTDLSAYLNASVLSEAAANTIFKLNDDLVAGWVMNLEGDKPFSRYENYSFNSFAKIGGQYYAASDDGLHTLAGDTDDGSEINASLTSMMLDFDTSAHKRVVAAYLGYTASKQLILKVRSVDQGQLVEHWYEARDQLANAPRENYMQLGRGLKSRYWQFELVNVDGGDFEVDSLELWPLVLNRRV